MVELPRAHPRDRVAQGLRLEQLALEQREPGPAGARSSRGRGSVRRTKPLTAYPFPSSSSARNEPSWPVIPVISALALRRHGGHLRSVRAGRCARRPARAASSAVCVREAPRDHVRAAHRGDPRPPPLPGLAVAGPAKDRFASASSSPGATSSSSSRISGSAPTRLASTGTPAAIASATASAECLGRARGSERDRGACPQPRQLVVVHRPSSRTSDVPASASRCPRSGPSPATTSDIPARRQAAIATSIPFSGGQPRDDECVAPRQPAPRRGRASAGRSAAGVQATRTRSHGSGAPSSARRSRAKRLGTRITSASCHQPTLPGRQRGGVEGGLRDAAAAVAGEPWERVASVAAGALLAAGEAHPDRAHEPVLVQVQHHPRPRLTSRRQRPPAEARLQVVSVDQPGARPPHGVRDLPRGLAAAQQPQRRLRPPGRRRVAGQQLGALAEVLTDEPQQILHHALLATGGAVAVMEEQDHRRGERYGDAGRARQT